MRRRKPSEQEYLNMLSPNERGDYEKDRRKSRTSALLKGAVVLGAGAGIFMGARMGAFRPAIKKGLTKVSAMRTPALTNLNRRIDHISDAFSDDSLTTLKKPMEILSRIRTNKTPESIRESVVESKTLVEKLLKQIDNQMFNLRKHMKEDMQQTKLTLETSITGKMYEYLDKEILKIDPVKERALQKRTGFRHMTLGEAINKNIVKREDLHDFLSYDMNVLNDEAKFLRTHIADPLLLIDDKDGSFLDFRGHKEKLRKGFKFLERDFGLPFVGFNPLDLFYTSELMGLADQQKFYIFGKATKHPTITNDQSTYNKLAAFIGDTFYDISEKDNKLIPIKKGSLVSSRYGPIPRTLRQLGGFSTAFFDPPTDDEPFYKKAAYEIGRVLNLGRQDVPIKKYGVKDIFSMGPNEALGNVVTRIFESTGITPSSKLYTSMEGVFGESNFMFIPKIKTLKESKGYGDFFKQLYPHRSKMDEFTSLGAMSFQFFSRLNDGLGMVGLGLSVEDLTSPVDIFKNLLLKRALPVVAGVQAWRYLNYESQNILGVRPNEIIADNFLGVQADYAGALERVGIVDRFKEMKPAMPGFEELQQLPVVGPALQLDRSFDETVEYHTRGMEPIRKGRYWSAGSTPLIGGRVDRFIPTTYRRLKANPMFTENWLGSEDEYFAHSLMPTPRYPFAPLQRFMNPYHHEERTYHSRPYPLAGGLPEFEEFPLIGAALQSTVGRIIKPPKRMHPEFWSHLRTGQPMEYDSPFRTPNMMGVAARSNIAYSPTHTSGVFLETQRPPMNYEHMESAAIRSAGSFLRFVESGFDIPGITYQETLFVIPDPTGKLTRVSIPVFSGESNLTPVDHDKYIEPSRSQLTPVQGGGHISSGRSQLTPVQGGGHISSGRSQLTPVQGEGYVGASRSNLTHVEAPISIPRIRSSITPVPLPDFKGYPIAYIGESGSITPMVVPPGGSLSEMNQRIRSKSPASMGAMGYSSQIEHPELFNEGMNVAGELLYNAQVVGGFYGFTTRMATGDHFKDPRIATSSAIYSPTRQFWSWEIGRSGAQANEIGRRFIPRREFDHHYNPIPNEMPSWIPGEDSYLDLRVGDPYAKLKRDGEMRLPGEAFESLWDLPELQEAMSIPAVSQMVKSGELNPAELYSPITRLRILSDVAPHSDEYRLTSQMISQMPLSEYEQLEVDKIRDQAAERKKGMRLYPYQFKGSELSYLNVRVGKVISNNEFTVREFPNQKIKLAGIRLPTAQDDPLALEVDRIIRRAIKAGSTITIGVDPDSISQDARGTIGAVVYAGNVNLNKQLLDSGLAKELEGDISAPGIHARFTDSQIRMGGIWERFAHLDTPFHTKFLNVRSPLESYERKNLYGKDFQDWRKPVQNFIIPTLQSISSKGIVTATLSGGLIGALFGKTPKSRIIAGGIGAGIGLVGSSLRTIFKGDQWVPKRRQKEWELNEYLDTLKYVRNLRTFNQAARDAKKKDRVDVNLMIQEEERLGGKRKREIKNLEDLKRILETDSSRMSARKLHKILSHYGISSDGAGGVRDAVRNINARIKDIRGKEALPIGSYTAKALAAYQEVKGTMYAFDGGDVSHAISALPRGIRPYFSHFVNANKRDRNRIKNITPPYAKRLLKYLWGEGLEYRKPLEDYFQDKYLPSENWAGWNPEIPWEAVRTRIIQESGVDESDMDVWDQDRRMAEAFPVPVPRMDVSSSSSSNAVRRELMSLLGESGYKRYSVSAYPSKTFGINLNVFADKRREVETFLDERGYQAF